MYIIQQFSSALTNKKLRIRLISGFTFFYLLFFSVVIISYFLLPEGFLRSKSSAVDLELSNGFWLHVMQILGYNLISVMLILIFNCFIYQLYNWGWIPTGYFMLGILFIMNGATLGTWSFMVVSAAPGLLGRLLRQFDILHRSGFWEMSGQLLITCASCNIAYKRKEQNVRFSLSLFAKNEKMVVLIGFMLMLCGAIIETNSIFTR